MSWLEMVIWTVLVFAGWFFAFSQAAKFRDGGANYDEYTSTAEWEFAGGSKADAVVELSYDRIKAFGFYTGPAPDEQGDQLALVTCQNWGFASVSAASRINTECRLDIEGREGRCYLWTAARKYQCAY